MIELNELTAIERMNARVANVTARIEGLKELRENLTKLQEALHHG